MLGNRAHDFAHRWVLHVSPQRLARLPVALTTAFHTSGDVSDQLFACVLNGLVLSQSSDSCEHDRDEAHC
jgi:hypothetical protein